jgi:activator of HSP90 ATPase
MEPSGITRRQFSVSLGAICSVLGLSCSAFGSAAEVSSSGISRDGESIHQEVVLKASRNRVYEALLDAKQFGKLTGSGEAEISREPGGAFSCFGGAIGGRNIELVPNERIVQAWRANSWAAGVYSIARFQFTEEGAHTKLSFDHTGFPKGQADHLAGGWKEHYWEALEQYFAA